MRTLLPLCFGLVLVAACGSYVENPLFGDQGGAGGAGGAGSGASGSTSGAGGAAPGTKSYVVKFEPVTVPPGTERTQCVVKKLGNDEIAHIHQIHNQLPNGSHHLIVYRTNDTQEQLTPFDCQPFTDTLDPTKGSPLMITQKHEEWLNLPDGVAFTAQPGTMVRLELHYINATVSDIQVSATSTFYTMPDADYKYDADFLFIGNPDIKIAPHTTATLGPTFLPLPEDLTGVNFFGITGHEHQWGTNVQVSVAASKAGPDTSVYDVKDWLWSEPATVYHDPPFTVPQGGGFRFTCSWNNKGDTQVKFGESANDEMCFFWAYYYPSKGARVCAHTDQVGSFDLCCPGNALCSQLFGN
jgi:hypothetical protein